MAAHVHDAIGHADSHNVAVEAGLPVERAVLHVQAQRGTAVAGAFGKQGVAVLGKPDHLEGAIREARRGYGGRRAVVGKWHERAVCGVDRTDADTTVTTRSGSALLEAALDDARLAGVGGERAHLSVDHRLPGRDVRVGGRVHLGQVWPRRREGAADVQVAVCDHERAHGLVGLELLVNALPPRHWWH